MIITDAYRRNYGEITWSPIKPTPRKRRERRSAPHVILDTMDATWHPATGEMIDSKSKFRQRTRERGCEEVGNERFPAREKPSRAELQSDIRRAVEQLRERG